VKGLKVSNETKVGALTAIAITILVLGYNFLKGKDLFTSTTKYNAIYTRIDGLAASNPVTVNGYRVGQVTSVSLIKGDSIRVKVGFEVNSDIVVRDSTIAKIVNSDFFGSKAIELVLTNKSVALKEGDTLISEMEPALISSVTSIVTPIKDKAESLIVSLDSVFGGESGRKLQGTIDNINAITADFKKTSSKLDGIVEEERKKLNAILADVKSVTTMLESNNGEIAATIKNLKSISDTLAAVEIQSLVTKAKNTLAQVHEITEKINKGEGSIGLLVNDKQLYNDLDETAKSLDALLKDMKENPKRYVHFSIFGRKDKKKKEK
jgi:phospholipid/cholesterol/gamma-HCH transport system substrate-binding protein